jgi:hypothetical protein
MNTFKLSNDQMTIILNDNETYTRLDLTNHNTDFNNYIKFNDHTFYLNNLK